MIKAVQHTLYKVYITTTTSRRCFCQKGGRFTRSHARSACTQKRQAPALALHEQLNPINAVCKKYYTAPTPDPPRVTILTKAVLRRTDFKVAFSGCPARVISEKSMFYFIDFSRLSPQSKSGWGIH